MNRNSYGCRTPDIRDYGSEPLIVNIDCFTKQNPYYRTALWTGKHLQVTLMSIPVHGDIGIEKMCIRDRREGEFPARLRQAAYQALYSTVKQFQKPQSAQQSAGQPSGQPGGQVRGEPSGRQHGKGQRSGGNQRQYQRGKGRNPDLINAKAESRRKGIDTDRGAEKKDVKKRNRCV